MEEESTLSTAVNENKTKNVFVNNVDKQRFMRMVKAKKVSLKSKK